MEPIAVEDYTAMQLRNWLDKLDLPRTGNKAVLAARINEVPPEVRGSCPRLDEDSFEEEPITNVAPRDTTLMQTGNDIPHLDAENGSDADDGVEETRDENMIMQANVENNTTHQLETLRRQLQLLQLENDALKAQTGRNVSVTLPHENNGTSRQYEVATPAAVAHDTHISGKNNITLTIAKEMITDFDGNYPIKVPINIWVSQLKTIASMYELSDDNVRVLIMTKLKDQAQVWLHSNANLLTIPVAELLNQLCEMFLTKESKISARRKFLGRKWQAKEDFAAYFKEKMQLAINVQMDDEELIDNIIEGIPNDQLRNQAYLQSFTTSAQLLHAFSKVSLKNLEHKERRQNNNTTSAADPATIRCFNCNSLGHIAAECRKPKREYGSCYGCGSSDHKIAQCSQKKNVPKNEYVRNFKIYFKEIINQFLCLECLIDSGSPISFVKQSSLGHIRKIFETTNLKSNEMLNLNYFGLNNSRLNIIGKIPSFVIMNKNEYNFELLIVTDESMGYDAVLGRDFMNICKFKIIRENDSSENDSIINENPQRDRRKNDSILNKSSMNKQMIDSDNKNDSTRNYIKTNETQNDSLRNHNYANVTNDCIQNERGIYNTSMAADILAIEYPEPNDPYSLNTGAQCNPNLKERLINTFNKYYSKAKQPEIPIVKCEMKLNFDNVKPFHYPPRRLSYTEKAQVQELLDEYLEKGIIRESESEYASPIVLVKKKTGELRMCVDYRTLNKSMLRDNYPTPLIDDLIDKLAGKQFFTKLDLKNGYFHVFMHEDSIKYTSFTTPMGQFEWQRMPFGLRNAPAVFQRFIYRILNDLIRESKVLVYMDDILIATKDSESHFEILKEVLNRLVANKLELRLDKCEFFYTEVKYLGYLVSGKGIKPDTKGLQAVKNFPTPQKAHDVQSFIGLCSYFRRFIKDFSTKAKPLYDLIRKDKKFEFGEKELECFELLKNNLLEAPILALYNPNDPTELHCDASALGFGAILMQRKSDDKLHPVFYFSKRTTDVETRYHSFELETLAIIYSLQRFRIYLQGIQFKIVTDCSALTMALSKRDLSPRIARWALELQNYDYTLEHRSGKRMQHVDALSRNTHILTIDSNSFEESLIICQNKDKNIIRIREKLQNVEDKHYEMRNGVIYRKKDSESLLFYVPQEMEDHVLYKYHNELGHIGIDKMIDTILKSYWFPNIKAKAKQHISNCLKCIAYSAQSGKNEGFLHNIPKESIPFDVIHIDHYGPIDNSRANKHILVIIDAFTKFVRLYPAKTTKSREAVVALKDYFRAYSRPKCLISDRGTCFTSKEFEEFLEEEGVKHVKIATGSPQANGQVERVNRIIGPMIAKLIEPDKGKHWDTVLETVEYALNNTVQRSINDHPSKVMFGVSQKGIVPDILRENLQELDSNQISRDLNEIRHEADKQIKKVQEYNKNAVDTKRSTPHKYKKEDLVMIKNFDSHTGISKKLIPKFKGPYRITKILQNDRYVLEDVENFQQSRLPYKGIWAVANIRPWLDKNNQMIKQTLNNKRSGALRSGRPNCSS